MAGRRFVLGLLLVPSIAAADGERTPIIGGAIVGAGTHEDALGGVQADATWWAWRLGVSAEGAMLWRADATAKRAAVLGVSARLLAFDTLVESLLEPRNVELGVELHGIVERWIDDDSTTRYGVGLALRLRGGSDYDMSNLLAESRFFVRVMTTPAIGQSPIVGRMITPPTTTRDSGSLTIMVGVGAAFGTGDPDYLQRFRMEPFSPAAQRLASGWLE
jgi:hypothetical protein